MKRTFMIWIAIVSVIGIALAMPFTVLAQEEAPSTTSDLNMSTTYPEQIVEMGESITLGLKLNAIGEDQTVQLRIDEMPEGWEATFRGGGRIIQAVYVEAGSSETVDLRLDPPEAPEPGQANFVVLADGDSRDAELLVTLNIQNKVPASLSLTTDLPTIKGSPTTTFRYTTRLENSGDEDLTVNLQADTPSGFLTKFMVSGQDVTNLSLGADETKTVTVEIDPVVELAAGSYLSTIYATGGDLQASLDLAAEVTGEQELNITGLDGRLSGRANAGQETTLPILVRNTGTAPAQGVEMSASAPSGWTVNFDPELVPEIPAGSQAEVTAILTPAEKAVAGDYMVTMRARPVDATSESAEFRITVVTSTLWGVAGVALIAVAVGVVALAVMRFGRR